MQLNLFFMARQIMTLTETLQIDASMLGSALKITSQGWKTSTAPTFPQRGQWNSVLCSRLNLDTYHISHKYLLDSQSR